MQDHTTNEIPYGYCHCGCGQKTNLAQQDSKAFGHIKGEPVRFISGHQFRNQPTKPLAERLWARVRILGPNDCWEWQGYKEAEGYGRIKMAGKYSANIGTHRAAYEIAHGDIPQGMRVLHRCDNPPCCNPAHLFLGTDTDNVIDKVAKNRQARGERAPGVKLTAAQVTQIRQQYAQGDITIDKLAARYGLAATTIANIIHRRKWKHVP